MGSIRDIQGQDNIQSFPGSTYAITGDVPAAQCSEAKLEGVIGSTGAGGSNLGETNAFAGFALAGKKLTITSPPANAGTYDILGNSDSVVGVPGNPFSESQANIWYCHDGGTLILTRNAESFFRFLQTFNLLLDFPNSGIFNGFDIIANVGSFTEDYTGLQVSLLGLPQPYFGPHLILSNTIDNLTVDHTFDLTFGPIDARITDPDAAATTRKGGVVYTSMPTEKIQQACTIAFNPQP